MNVIIHILFYIVLFYLGYSVVYIFILAIAGKINQFNSQKISVEQINNSIDYYRRIAILIPAYKEDAVILSSVLSYDKLRYPKDRFDVYVIADQLKPETIAALSTVNAHIISVCLEKSSKAKAINVAFDTIPSEYDIALISDADNILHPDFLTYINYQFSKGYMAVQGQRVAKNLNTPYAILDAASEMLNNHLFRRGNTALGLSSAVIGSGMAFDFALIKDVFKHIDVLGGFDKVLQLILTKMGVHIAYEPNAIVYDEKISRSIDLSAQRKRWLYTHFKTLCTYFKDGLNQLFKGNIDYFNLSVLQGLILPRVFLGLLLIFFSIFSFLICEFILHSYLLFYVFLFYLFIYVFSIWLSFPRIFIIKYLFPSFFYIPRVIWSMISALFSLHQARSNFIHTSHLHHQVNNPLYEYR
ncbi:MAG: glycosyltransferase family 2 protein [Thermoflavifilum sp.]|nr:glycosyltransferase family 2 protein [Thermoflavifilum sp.]